MQREIKFRAFDDGKMIYQNQTIMTDNIGKLWYFFKNIRKDVIVMEFTGIKDKTGKEIYEGDILKLANNETIKVIFKHGMFSGIRTNETNSISTFYWIYSEVIGNIYE